MREIELKPIIVPTILPIFQARIDPDGEECRLALQGLHEERAKGYASLESNVKASFVSSWLSHKENDKFLPLVSLVTDCCHDVLKEFFSVRKPGLNINCVNCWGAMYEPGDYTNVHHHVPFLFSACVYLDLEEGHSNILFDDTEVLVERGSLLIFPGYLRHSVPPTTGKRVTVAMNFTVTHSKHQT